MPTKIAKTNKKIKEKKLPQMVSDTPEIVQSDAKKVFFAATGKRKTAVAQIRFYPNGQGEILINNKSLAEYFPYFVWQDLVLAPIVLVGLKKYRIIIKVKGGGINSQVEAIRLGISRALLKMNPEFRFLLKKAKFLTRDARIKERKKPGLKRARRAPQWQKR